MRKIDYYKSLEDIIMRGITLIRMSDMISSNKETSKSDIDKLKNISTEFFNMISEINSCKLNKTKKQFMTQLVLNMQAQTNSKISLTPAPESNAKDKRINPDPMITIDDYIRDPMINIDDIRNGNT